MQVNFTNTSMPVPIPPPSPTIPKTINFTILMNDSFGDGWNGNIFGFKQNNIIIGSFGNNFTTGKTFGPVNVTLPSLVQTQIVVVQFGNWTEEIGFTIKAPNGTIIFTRKAGTAFNSKIIFLEFCPSSGCPIITNVTYYLTVTDSYGDGWNGNVLAFRQNGTLQQFSLQKGYSSGPSSFVFTKGLNVDIIVYTIKNWTQ